MRSSSEVQLICDRLGFPAVTAGGVGLSLLPVTWFQLERFLAEPDGLGNAWYRQVHREVGTPRGSWRTFNKLNRETVFVRGVLMPETDGFVAWMNRGANRSWIWTVPEAETWRKFGKLLLQLPFDAAARAQLEQCDMHLAARTLIERLDRQLHPESWGDLALLVGNVFEWVSDRHGHAMLGAPRREQLPTTFNPFADKPVRHFGEGRDRFVGVRLCCRDVDS